MKKTKFLEIKTQNIEELLKKVSMLKAELIDLTLDQNRNKQKDIKLVFKKRKDLAQVLTVLRQKQLLEQLELNVAAKKIEKGEKEEVVLDDLAEKANKKSKARTKSVQKKKV